MKRSIVIAVTSILSISLIACQADRAVVSQVSSKQSNSVTATTAKNDQPKETPLRKLSTDPFTLLLPADWTVKEGKVIMDGKSSFHLFLIGLS